MRRNKGHFWGSYEIHSEEKVESNVEETRQVIYLYRLNSEKKEKKGPKDQQMHLTFDIYQLTT